MIYTAIAIFGMAVVIGLYLLTLILRDKQTPKGAAFIHGLFAFAGLILLIVFCFKNEVRPIESVISFSVAAFGGFILAYKDLTGRKIPKWLGIAHGISALIGFSYLLWFAFC